MAGTLGVEEIAFDSQLHLGRHVDITPGPIAIAVEQGVLDRNRKACSDSLLDVEILIHRSKTLFLLQSIKGVFEASPFLFHIDGAGARFPCGGTWRLCYPIGLFSRRSTERKPGSFDRTIRRSLDSRGDRDTNRLAIFLRSRSIRRKQEGLGINFAEEITAALRPPYGASRARGKYGYKHGRE